MSNSLLNSNQHVGGVVQNSWLPNCDPKLHTKQLETFNQTIFCQWNLANNQVFFNVPKTTKIMGEESVKQKTVHSQHLKNVWIFQIQKN